jgi:hypothetical protein
VSLSKTIIFSTEQAVADTLAQKPPLNEIDVYGYTPLIQTAIVNSASKCQLLIEAGADVNFTDLTGRSALHWATDNNNLQIAKLLLAKKADPNTYTGAGQPVLAMPFLREQNEMKDLLYKAGANLEFAQDFINAKVLGHRFDLQGRVDIVSPDNTFIEVEFEGFYSEFTLSLVLKSLLDFQVNFSAKHLKGHFHRISMIAGVLQNAIALIKYQHYLIDIVNYNDAINQLLDYSPLLLPVAYDGHAVSFIKFRNYLIRCDRGAFGRVHGTVIVYRIGKPEKFNKPFMKNLLYKRQSRQFIDEAMIQLLNLTPVDGLDLAVQLSGNCSWANVEAVIPIMLYLNLLEETQARSQTAVYDCKKAAIDFLQEWELWDQQRALHFCIESFHTATPARKASKAAVLMAILFQQQLYRDTQWHHFCERIANIITLPQYDYILRCYLEVFERDKVKQPMQPLLSFLDDIGIHFDIQKRY